MLCLLLLWEFNVRSALMKHKCRALNRFMFEQNQTIVQILICKFHCSMHFTFYFDEDKSCITHFDRVQLLISDHDLLVRSRSLEVRFDAFSRILLLCFLFRPFTQEGVEGTKQ